MPDAFGLVRGVDASGWSRGNGGQRGDEGARFGVGLRLGGRAELDNQKSVAGWEEFEVFNGLLLAAEGIEEISVDTFEADGFVLEYLSDVVCGEEDVGKANADESTAGRAFDELQGCAKDDGAGAFAADEGAGHVEIIFRE